MRGATGDNDIGKCCRTGNTVETRKATEDNSIEESDPTEFVYLYRCDTDVRTMSNYPLPINIPD